MPVQDLKPLKPLKGPFHVTSLNRALLKMKVCMQEFTQFEIPFNVISVELAFIQMDAKAIFRGCVIKERKKASG